MKFVKIVVFIIVVNLFTNIVLSQDYVSQDISSPTLIDDIGSVNLMFFNHQITSSFPPSEIAREYMGKDFYMSYINNTQDSYYLEINFQQKTNAGLSLYSISDGELIEKVFTQTISKDLKLVVPAATFLEDEIVLIRLWINESNAGGVFRIKTEPANYIIRAGDSPPSINTTSFTPEQLVTQILTSGCVEALNVQFTGNPEQIGYFSSGTPGLDFEDGIVMSTGYAQQVVGPNDNSSESGNMGAPGDPDLNDVIGGQTRDAAVLEFDFIPSTDHVAFQYVFASEEYEEYVGSTFNDVFAFFISGGPEAYNNQNIALIPGTTTPVSINNVNQNINTEYYINNNGGLYLEFDGLTTTLTAEADVTPCETYHMKLAIADVSDRIFDSGVFLKAGSFVSGASVVMKNFNAWGYLNSIHEGCENQLIFSRSDTSNINVPMDVDITITGSATMGDDYTTINTFYVIPAGEEYISIDYEAIADNFPDDNEYIVISIFNGCPCSVQVTTDSIRIDDQIEFDASIVHDDYVCFGDSVLLTVDMNPIPDTTIITWNNGMTGAEIYVSPESQTTYDVTIEYPCSSKSLSTTIDVVQLPEPVASNTGSYCEGDDIELSVSSAFSYRWKGPNGFVSTEQNPVITEVGLEYSGNYLVTVTDDNGCKAVTNTVVVVNPNPSPEILGPYNLCEGDTLVLNAGNYDTYQWIGPNGFSSTDNTPQIDGVTIDNSGLYQVLVLDDNLCRGTDDANFNIFPIPVPEINITSPVCEGDTVFLEITGGSSYIWEGPDSFVSTESQIELLNAETINAGIYSVTVTDNSCSDSISIELVVDTIPDATITPLPDLCEADDEIVLEAVSAGGLWSGNGITDINNGVFNPVIAGYGLHWVQYYVENGACSDIDSIQINLDEAIPPDIDNPGSFCDTDAPVILNAAGAGIWSGPGITDENIGEFTPAMANIGENLVYHTTENGVCILIDSVIINVYADVDASITPVGDYCEDDSPQNLNAATSGGTWSGNGITNSSSGLFDPNIAGSGDHYIYYEVGNGSCYDIDSVLIHVDAVPDPTISPAGPYCESNTAVNLFAATPGGVWSGTGITNSSSGLFDPGVAGPGNHEITYQVISGACLSSNNTFIEIFAEVDATISPETPLCESEAPITLNAVSSGGIWSGTGITDVNNGIFDPTVSGPGNFEIVYQVSNGPCNDSDTIQINVDFIPDASIIPPGPFCISSPAQNLIAVNPGGNWSGDGITDIVNGTFDPVTAGVGTHTTYYELVNGTCSSTDSIQIVVYDEVDATINNAGPFCIIDSENILTAADPGGEWSGNGIVNQSTGLFSPSLAGVGDHTIQYSIQNGACSDIQTTVIHVDSYPSVSVSDVDPFCENESPLNLNGSPAGGLWSGTGISDPINGIFDPSVSSFGNFTITYTITNGACTASANTTIHVDENIIPVINPAGPWCENNNPLTLTASQSGGTWSGTGITNASLGTFNPQVSGCGDFVISYQLNNGTCSNTDTETFHVDCIPDASIIPVPDVCETDGLVNLTANNPGGVWSGTAVSGNQFDPSIAGAGSHYVYYTLTGGVCQSTDSTLITVDAEVDASIVNSGPYCESGVASLLSAGSPGGLWSGQGIVNPDTGLFDPFVAGVGNHLISYSVSNGTCSDSDTQIITVEAQPDASITPVGPFCITDIAVNLNAASAGGVWSGTGISDPLSGIFDPAIAGAGDHTISYNIVNGSCSDNDQIVIHVDDDVDATITSAGPFCVNSPAINLIAVDNGGTWSGTGIVNPSSGLFEPAFAGSGIHTITYQIINGACNDTDTENIVVDDETNPVITPVSNICETAGTINLNGSPAGGVWSGTGIIDTDAGIFDPLVAGDGTFNILYTVTNGACTNNTSINITVDDAVDASILTSGPFCQFDPPVILSAVSSGGVWSGTGITNSATGEFTPSVAGIGTHTITYNVVNGTCNDSDTQDIQVDEAFDASITSPGPICITDPVLNLTAATAGGIWSGAGIIDTNTGAFDPAIAGNGEHQITYTIDNGSCTSIDQISVFVYNTVVDASITPIPTTCITENEISLTAATPGGTWSGPGITDADAGIFDPAIAGPGNHIINYEVGNIACFDAASTSIQIDDTLPATITPAGPFCENNPDINLVAASGGGTWSGNGIVDAVNGTFDPATAGEGNHFIIYSIYSGVCTNTDETEIHVDGNVSAQINPDGPFCIDQASVVLSAASPNGIWSGTGITNINNGTFTPAVAGVGTHTITYEVTNGECSDIDTENFIVDAIPNTTINPVGPFCQTDPATNLSADTPGGTWSGNGITDVSAGIFDPTIAGAGNHLITYSLNLGACSNSSSITIHVDADVDASITPAGPFCETEASLSLNAVSTGGTWSGTGIINTSLGIFHPGIATGGNHTISYTVSNGECSDNDDITIIVYSNPDPQITDAGPFCETQSPVNLNVNEPGGVWSGNGITDASAGIFDPGIAGAGNHNITYTVGNGTCLAETSTIIHVDNSVDATITPAGPFCETDSPITLTAMESGGLWSGNGITNVNSGIFNPGIAGQGNHTINYSITNGECSDDDNIIIHVDDVPDASIIGTYAFCEDDSPVNLNSASPGGIWSGTGITDAVNGTFDPTLAQAGNHSITYTLTNGECVADDNINIEISESVDATITPAGPYCETQTTVNLNAVSSGGTWSGTGIIDAENGVFSPAVAQVGSHTITYTVANVNCSDTDTQIIQVDDFPDATIISTGPYCISEGVVSLNASSTGGVWSGNGIVDELTGAFDPQIAGAGSHNITYTITNGSCNANDNQIIVVDEAVDASISETGPYCETQSSVSLSAVSPGGIWSGTGITNVNQGLFSPVQVGAGTYTVQYSVQNGSCSDTDTYDILVDEYPDPSISDPGALCINSNPITLSTATSGGIWAGNGIIDDSTGEFDPMLAGVGTHNITYNIVNGVCSASDNIDILISDTSFIEFIALDNSMCLNEAAQEINVNISGGSFTGNGLSGNMFIPQNAGIGDHIIFYSFINENSCLSEISATITVNGLPGSSFSGLDTDYCLNDNSSQLTGTPAGGVFEGQGVSGNSFLPENAGVGTHTVIYHYTDNNSCTDTAYFDVTVHSIPEINFDSINYPSCNGLNNGSIYISVSEGTPNYIYYWSGGTTSVNQDITALYADMYYIQVTDARGCTVNDSVSLIEPDALQLSINLINNVSCNAYSDGAVSTEVTGGTPPYVYTWDDENAGNNPAPNNLSAGTYMLTVTDDNNCIAVETITITEPDAVQMIIDNIEPVSCYGFADGSVSVHAEGGTEPYTYSWQNPPGGNTPNLANLQEGTYQLSITDNAGCQSEHQVNITSPDPIEISATITNVDCGNSLGSISVVVTGGTQTYIYEWSEGGSNGPVNSNLVAGSYTLSVTDANDCFYEQTFRVDPEGTNDVVISQTEFIECFGDNSASLTGNMPQGVPEFEYIWSNGVITPENEGLGAGSYSLTITDSWGCSGTELFLITQPTQINTLINTSNVNCYGNSSGNALINVSGGSPPYNILWENGATTSQIGGLPAGEYFVTITDNNNCQVVDSCNILQPQAPLNIDLDISPISCYGDTDGMINASGTGGTPPYQYYWYVDDNFVNTQIIRNLGQGVYFLTITDANSCLADSNIFIGQPRPLSADYYTSDPSCIGNYDGSIMLDISGGTEPYTYFVNGNEYAELPIDSLYQGLYQVVIIDEHDCELIFEEVELEDTYVDCLIIPNAFTPNGDGYNDTWEIGNIGLFPRAFIQVYNRWGQLIYEGLASEGFWDGTYNFSPVPTGSYLYIINLGTGADTYNGVVTVVR
jgi:gliding motility-associated-like protein